MANYKNTLNLPYTNFSMRANLLAKEPKILLKWEKEKLYKIISHKKKKKDIFILHDGPPYANGSIHIGHFVNKVLKDIIIKSKNLEGFNVSFIPGWDCHGLPIEHEVEKNFLKIKKKFSYKEFRLACRKYAKKQLEKQKIDFMRIGIIINWNKFYSTMDFSTEANTIRVFGKIIKNGYLKNGIKPVHWCLNCFSSLAEAEIKYKDKKSLSVYIKFEVFNKEIICDLFKIKNLNFPIFALVWTTAIWTIPGSQAIAINPNYTYQLVCIDDSEYYIIEKSFVKSIIKKCGIKNWKILSSKNGKSLFSLFFLHPFMKYSIPLILSNHVDLKYGTGLVHISPAHGPEDYILSKKYKLKVRNLVDSKGIYYNNIFFKLNNCFVFDSEKILVSVLNESKSLLFSEIYKHSFPHCWRHKKPVIFRSTSQWFFNLEKNNFKKSLLKEINKVKWIPEKTKLQFRLMIKNRPDWCISRQRYWGVPIVLFVHKKTKKLHLRTLEIIEEVARGVEKEGVQYWWDLKPSSILGSDYKDYQKVEDILDVWFDSGSTFFTVINNAKSKFHRFPIDVYFEGSDQHRGWFMSSAIISFAINGKLPFKEVLTHAFVINQEGFKISKSEKNFFSLKEIMNKYSVDILRLWIASLDFSTDMYFSKKIIDQISDDYKKIRNTLRFLLSNLVDFNPKLNKIPYEDMVALDKWIIKKTQLVQFEIISNYKSYNFHLVTKRIVYFCSVELSSFYLEIIKDRKYTIKSSSMAYRSCQTAIFYILEFFVRWISPILPFTADEVWSFLPERKNKFVFLEEYYSKNFNFQNDQFDDLFWNKIFLIKKEVNKIIENYKKQKVIKTSLECSIILFINNKLMKLLSLIKKELKFLFLTSKVRLKDISKSSKFAISSNKVEGLKIVLEKSNGEKCFRCWHYDISVGKNYIYKDLCFRCIDNIIGNGEIRKFI